jgi:predicted transcriptional regulator
MSIRKTARKIAKDTGESEEAVRNRIKRGRKKMGQVDPPTLKEDYKFILKEAKQIKTERREKRVRERSSRGWSYP